MGWTSSQAISLRKFSSCRPSRACEVNTFLLPWHQLGTFSNQGTIYGQLVVLRIRISCLSKVWYQVIGEFLIPLVGWDGAKMRFLRTSVVISVGTFNSSDLSTHLTPSASWCPTSTWCQGLAIEPRMLEVNFQVGTFDFHLLVPRTYPASFIKTVFGRYSFGSARLDLAIPKLIIAWMGVHIFTISTFSLSFFFCLAERAEPGDSQTTSTRRVVALRGLLEKSTKHTLSLWFRLLKSHLGLGPR